MAQQPLVGQGHLITDASRSHLDTQHSSGRVISSIQKPLSDSTQHSKEAYIEAFSGIRNRNPSKWAAVEPCLRPRGHRDRQNVNFKFVDHPFSGLTGPHFCLYGYLTSTEWTLADRLHEGLRQLMALYCGRICRPTGSDDRNVWNDAKLELSCNAFSFGYLPGVQVLKAMFRTSLSVPSS
jgi:hypothetical protein